MGELIFLVIGLYLLHAIGWLVPLLYCAGVVFVVAAIWMIFAAAVCFLLELTHSGD